MAERERNHCLKLSSVFSTCINLACLFLLYTGRVQRTDGPSRLQDQIPMTATVADWRDSPVLWFVLNDSFFSYMLHERLWKVNFLLPMNIEKSCQGPSFKFLRVRLFFLGGGEGAPQEMLASHRNDKTIFWPSLLNKLAKAIAFCISSSLWLGRLIVKSVVLSTLKYSFW